MSPDNPNRTNWKAKLAAYLHDSPSKALDIKFHEERARAAYARAGFTEEEQGRFAHLSDHTAAAADRLPFPQWRSSGLTCAFDGIRNTFHHPMGGSTLPFDRELSVVEAETVEQHAQPQVECPPDWNAEDPCGPVWRARFLAHWRIWQQASVERDWRMGFLPADTRIPDHTIWNHMQVVSALESCCTDRRLEASFLKIQIGPVQEFIAQARSVRDLWSGSFLLSWLMSVALAKLALEVGPDAVVFPNLKGQPLIDLHLRDAVWSKLYLNGKNAWESYFRDQDGSESNQNALTPNFPNVALAVVPTDRAEALAKLMEQAIQAEVQTIAASVWQQCADLGLTADEGALAEAERKARFDRQVERMISVSWQVHPFPKNLDQADAWAQSLPDSKILERFRAVRAVFEQQLPVEHRDARYYTDDVRKDKLNNPGLAWSLAQALVGWELDAVRQTRNFSGWNTGQTTVGVRNNKDSLNGKEEAVAGGRDWGQRVEALEKTANRAVWQRLFKHPDWLGASTLIKRVWHLSYLPQFGLKTDARHYPMPDTYGIAMGTKHDDSEEREGSEESPHYFAVLALDGDQIGKWMSGEKCPVFREQLADYTDAGGQVPQGALPYFERHAQGLLDQHRLVSPGYHLQFSEALSNFALRCARPIVESFSGRLIYAGGDDVLAMLPADRALACAEALRVAFRGDKSQYASRPEGEQDPIWNGENPSLECHEKSPGFMIPLDKAGEDGRKRPVPFVVPGPKADVSVGIAVAHFKQSLQQVVREAQAAEKRAKKQHGRAAVAFTLIKRSGETIHWGARFAEGGIDLLQSLLRHLERVDSDGKSESEKNARTLSAKFPYRVIQLLEPYLNPERSRKTADSAFKEQVRQILRAEFDHALHRQSKDYRQVSELLKPLDVYLENLPKENATEPPDPVARLIGLCQTAAFLGRQKSSQP